MKFVNEGMTRFVILTENYAIKLPRPWWGWFWFLMGMIANLSERGWWREYGRGDDRLCPILWGDPLGLVVIMPRCQPISTPDLPDLDSLAGLPRDYKCENFGRLPDGRVVLVDYAQNARRRSAPFVHVPDPHPIGVTDVAEVPSISVDSTYPHAAQDLSLRL